MGNLNSCRETPQRVDRCRWRQTYRATAGDRPDMCPISDFLYNFVQKITAPGGTSIHHIYRTEGNDCCTNGTLQGTPWRRAGRSAGGLCGVRSHHCSQSLHIGPKRVPRAADPAGKQAAGFVMLLSQQGPGNAGVRRNAHLDII